MNEKNIHNFLPTRVVQFLKKPYASSIDEMAYLDSWMFRNDLPKSIREMSFLSRYQMPTGLKSPDFVNPEYKAFALRSRYYNNQPFDRFEDVSNVDLPNRIRTRYSTVYPKTYRYQGPRRRRLIRSRFVRR